MKRLLALFALGLGGCASLSTVHSARALKPGETRIGANGSLVGGGVPGFSIHVANSPVHDVGFPVPQVEVEVRHGFAPRWEWGVRTFLLGAAGDVKFQFLEGAKWDAAFVPGSSITYLFLPVPGAQIQLGESDVSLPVLFGRPLRGGSELVVGPKAQARWSFENLRTPDGSGVGTRFILLGGATSVLRLGLGRGWSMPLELSVYDDFTEGTGVSYSAGLGIAFTPGAP